MESGNGNMSGAAGTAGSPAVTRAAARAAAAADADAPPADVDVQITEGDEDDSAPTAKKQKKCTSKVWLHFTKEKVTTIGPDSEEVVELWAKCNRCKYKARADSNRGTTAFMNHLRARHNVKLGQQTLSLVKGDGNTTIVQTSNRYDPEVSLRKWHMALIMHDYPFAMAEHEYFVDFIKSLRYGFSFKSRITTRKLIIEMHLEEKQNLYLAQDGLKVIASSVRNIRATITVVKNSTLQWEAFMKCAKEENLDVTKGLSLDCTTRWNSTYLMLKNAIYYRKAFDKLVFLNKSKYKNCSPGDKEWDKVVALTRLLKKFNDATEIFSASLHPTVNLFWRKFCEIMLAIDEWSRSKDAGTAAMAKAMKEKYNKYWEKSNMALAVGCFLDPRYNKKLVEFFMSKIYDDEYDFHMNSFMAAVNHLFQAYMSNGQDSEKTSAATTSVITQEGHDIFLDDMDEDIQNYLYENPGQQDVEKSEIESYLKEEPVRWNDKNDGTFDILAWWKGKQGTYPVLARLARDVLAIQVSTVASESAFSAGGRVVDPFRTRLDPEVVEALICTKDWIAAGKRAYKLKIASLIDELEMVIIEPEPEPEASGTKEPSCPRSRLLKEVILQDETAESSSDESD
ncbi:hypothetical protein ACQ4PT_064700 [Festuca glaucescens]